MAQLSELKTKNKIRKFVEKEKQKKKKIFPPRWQSEWWFGSDVCDIERTSVFNGSADGASAREQRAAPGGGGELAQPQLLLAAVPPLLLTQSLRQTVNVTKTTTGFFY